MKKLSLVFIASSFHSLRVALVPMSYFIVCFGPLSNTLGRRLFIMDSPWDTLQVNSTDQIKGGIQ